MKRVLVTGGAGFIGSNLIKKLIETHPEIEILSIDNYSTGKKENHIDSKNVTYHTASTWDYFDTNFDNHKPFDVVFHFGEYSRIVKSFDDVDYVMKTNLHGTTRILEICRKWNAKLIYSASSSIFGNNKEDQHLNPYAWTKSKIVELIKNYKNWYGLNYEICYFYNVYGNGQITEGDYATVIGIFETQYKSNKPLTVVSPGTQSRDFTHVDDIVDGVLKSVNKNMNYEWFLKSGLEYQLIDVAKMFTKNIVIIPEKRGERKKSTYTKNTNKLLGWAPKKNLKEYINSLKNG